MEAENREIMDQRFIAEVTDKIVERFAPRRVILFGSHARGCAGPDSDLDLFIEMETDQRSPERAIAVSALFGLRSWPLDVVIYTPQEVGRLRNVTGSLLTRIEAEGKILYERP